MSLIGNKDEDMKCITSVFLFLVAHVSFAQGVPNTFTAGQPALAAEVNENFANLGTRASDNATNIGTNVDNIAQSLGGIVLTQVESSDGSGVVGTSCPVNSIVGSTQCSCSSESGTRNFGVLFACELAGNGGVAACFDYIFDPNLPSPLVSITLVCVSGVQNDGTPIVPTFAKGDRSLAAKIDNGGLEIEAALKKAHSAVSEHRNRLQILNE